MTEPLTAQDLKALRSAKSIAFHYAGEPGVATIRVRIDHDPGDGFGPRELTRDIPVGAMVTTYERPAHLKDKSAATSAVWMITCASVDQDWRTVVGLLHAGDVVTACWYNGNNSDALRNAGFNAVEFRLEVERTTAKSRKYLHFLLGYTIEPAVTPAPSVSYV